MTPSNLLPAPITPSGRLLTAARFQQLADVPPEFEWFANLANKSTRRAYENALQDFMRFTGIARPEEFRQVTRAHVIAWRDDLVRRVLSGMTIRHRLAALSSLFEYLCEKNTVTHNPVNSPLQVEDAARSITCATQWRKLLVLQHVLAMAQPLRTAGGLKAPLTRLR